MEFSLLQFLMIALGAFGAGSVGCFFLLKSDRFSASWGTVTAFIGSAACIALGLSALGTTETFARQFVTPFIPFVPLEIYIDKLGGLFLVIIGTIALLATVYGFGYMKHFYGKYAIGVFYAFYNLFIGSMVLVVIANNSFFFLVMWEIMSLASYFLVVFDHHEEENVRAGFLYFIVTHIATAFLVVMFFLFYRATGSLSFDTFRMEAGNISPLLSGIIFILALIGFGTKAGIIPLHVWLPNAHPAAPSQVSALMSGVMIKLGVFMLIRVFLDFFAATPAWLGLTVLILGALSSLLGVLYALGEHDIKRLLAYHSIENIGIILLGVGGALFFRSMGEDMLALLSLAAALFHTANHAVFKSLLFMSAGAVVAATHTRNIEKYGGLIKRMPYTAFFFLIGSIAISGIVPFNGFVSEWLTFQSLIGGLGTHDAWSQIVLILGIAALATTGGLAAACFVKAFGVTFLARPRSEDALHAEEADIGMRGGMAVLAVIAVMLGIFGGSAAKFFASVAMSLPIATGSDTSGVSVTAEALSVEGGFGTLNMPLIVFAILLALLATWIMVRFISGKRRVSVRETWDCGFPLTPRMEITATAFSRSLIMIFHKIFRPKMHIETTVHDASRPHFLESLVVSLHLEDLYHKHAYHPIGQATLRGATIIQKVQNGSTNMYLLYVLFVLLALLAWAAH